MLNSLWLGLILISVLLGALTGRLDAVTNGAFAAAKDAVMVIALPLAGLMGLWLGFLRLADLAGLVEALARLLHPLLKFLFPDIPAGHPALGSMVLNMAANMLGLGNAATPFGLRAMRDLESLNPNPGIASNAMCTFLAINTSSIQLVPATAIAILAAQGSKQPTAVLASALLASFTAAVTAIAAVKILQRLPVFRVGNIPQKSPVSTQQETSPSQSSHDAAPSFVPRPLSSGGRICLSAFGASFVLLTLTMLFPDLFTGALSAFSSILPEAPKLSLPALPESLQNQSGLPKALGTLSLLAVPFLLAFFALYAALRGVKVYEEFVTGAKEGWQVAMRVIPYLLAILVGVRMFREAGAIELVAAALSPILQPLGVQTDLLPLILVRPLSGSATTGLFTELVTRFGADSLTARTAATIYGSTETTFYVLAVYFGSVAIHKGRHALATGLIADATGALASIYICRWLFA
jgi:spore maturation protein SpmA